MRPALRRGSAVRADGRPGPRAVRRGAGVGDAGRWRRRAKAVKQRPCFNDFRKSEFRELRLFLPRIGSAAD